MNEGAQPRWGWGKKLCGLTQGSSFLATLGFGAESLWDSRPGAIQRQVTDQQRLLVRLQLCLATHLVHPRRPFVRRMFRGIIELVTTRALRHIQFPAGSQIFSR